MLKTMVLAINSASSARVARAGGLSRPARLRYWHVLLAPQFPAQQSLSLPHVPPWDMQHDFFTASQLTTAVPSPKQH
jgi:hypothetical protein